MATATAWAAIAYLLANDTAYAALATGGVFHNMADEDRGRPLCVLRVATETPYKSLGGMDNFGETLLDIIHYSAPDQKDVADNMRARARALLAGTGPQTVTVGADSLFISSINEADTQPDVVKGPDGKDLGINAVVQRIVISHAI